jgi:tetratricopeptide (TPR) repeat protein
VEAFRKELHFRKQVVVECPNMVPYLPAVALCSVRLGDALRKIAAEDEAIAAYQEAVSACREASHRQPKDNEAYIWWGIALARLDAAQEAAAVWEQGRQHGADMAAAADGAAGFLRESLDPQTQNPKQAVLLAQKAAALAPQSGMCWGTLGAAYYRAGQWEEAVDALEKALPLESGRDSLDWFFLAMAHWQLGDHEEACRWYDQAVQWMVKNKPRDKALHGFCAEAATLLGIQEEPLHK